MNKKAQLIGQVFIFIIAGLVFILILMYGYKAVSSFLQKGEQVQLIDFRNELESTVNVIKRDYGSVQRVQLRLPAKLEEVCLVTEKAEDVASSGWVERFKQERPLLYSAWATGTENVFTTPRQQTPIFIKDVIVDPDGAGYLCTESAGGVVVLRVEGTGSKARITEWQDA